MRDPNIQLATKPACMRVLIAHPVIAPDAAKRAQGWGVFEMSCAGSSVIFDLLPPQAMSLLPAIAIFGALLLPKTVASACLLSAGFSPFLDGFRAYLDHAAFTRGMQPSIHISLARGRE